MMGLLQYLDQHGLWTQWYWPQGCRGKVWNYLHGYGWMVQ